MRFKNASFKTRLNLFVWPSAGVLSSNLIYEKLKKFKRQNGIYWNLNLTDFFSSDIIPPPLPPPTESVFSLTSYRPVCGCCWTRGTSSGYAALKAVTTLALCFLFFPPVSWPLWQLVLEGRRRQFCWNNFHSSHSLPSKCKHGSA